MALSKQRKKYLKKYYQANKTKIKARIREYQKTYHYKLLNKEHISKYNKEYRQKNLEKIKLKQKQTRSKCKKDISKKRKEYHFKNRERCNHQHRLWDYRTRWAELWLFSLAIREAEKALRRK